MTSAVIVCALACEAAPVLDLYDLRARPKRPGGFRVHSGDGPRGPLHVLICGIGQVQAAAAVAWAAAQDLEPSPPTSWLNLGIAGHGRLPPGEVAEIVKFEQANGRGQRHAPPLYPAPLRYATSAPARHALTLWTVDRPEVEFAADVAYDMEGYAFALTARRFAAPENVRSIKVVSDGPGDDPRELDRTRISGLIERGLPHVSAELDALADTNDGLDVSRPAIDDYMARWHFTVTRQHELRELLRRYRVAYPNRDPLARTIDANPRDARAVLDGLRRELDLHCPDFGRTPGTRHA